MNITHVLVIKSHFLVLFSLKHVAHMDREGIND